LALALNELYIFTLNKSKASVYENIKLGSITIPAHNSMSIPPKSISKTGFISHGLLGAGFGFIVSPFSIPASQSP
jgi:hypothetical protein